MRLLRNKKVQKVLQKLINLASVSFLITHKRTWATHMSQLSSPPKCFVVPNTYLQNLQIRNIIMWLKLKYNCLGYTDIQRVYAVGECSSPAYLTVWALDSRPASQPQPTVRPSTMCKHIILCLYSTTHTHTGGFVHPRHLEQKCFQTIQFLTAILSKYRVANFRQKVLNYNKRFNTN